MLRIFRREMLTCRSLSKHPNIVSVFGACVRQDGIPTHLVMELMETSLAQLWMSAKLTKEYLTVREQLDIADDSISGIRYLHEQNPKPYLHCDIRSTNILIGTNMRAKIGDLGASHIKDASKSQSVGLLSGPYLAPERLSAPHNSENSRATLYSDIYSLGITLCELFIGESPESSRKARQLAKIENPKLKTLCLRMTNGELSKRPTARETHMIVVQEKESQRYTQCSRKRIVIGNSEGLKDDAIQLISI